MEFLDEVQNRGLNRLQLDEVKEGLKSLDIEVVNYYAWKKYDHLQMREIRLAFEHGLSIEQIDLFAKYPEEYSYRAMKNLEKKLLEGVGKIEEKYNSSHMEDTQEMEEIEENNEVVKTTEENTHSKGVEGWINGMAKATAANNEKEEDRSIGRFFNKK